MGVAIDTVAGVATNPGAGGLAVTFAPGDTGTVRNGRPTAEVNLEALWRKGAASGFARVRSPLLHDFVQGIRIGAAGGLLRKLTPDDFAQQLEPQDTLTVEVSGGAAEVDGVGYMVYYNDLPGASAILKMPGDVVPALEQQVGQVVSSVAGAAAGGWGDTAINATFDNFKGNRYYCMLGYVTDTSVLSVALKGPATSNLRIGGPGVAEPMETRDYFVRMSMAQGKPHIPVFNSADKAGTFVSTVDVAAATAATVTLILGLLPASWTP